MASIDERPKVGVGVVVFNNRHQVLLGRRKGGKHGDGEYSLAGGKPDPGEDPAYAAVRELYEETGLVPYDFDNPNFWTYDRFEDDGLHYVTLYFVSYARGQEPRNMEPDKCEGWAWYDKDDLPEPLFCGVREALEVIG